LRSTLEKRAFRAVGPYLAERGARLWLFGHTHHARVWCLDDPDAPLGLPKVELASGRRYVVNVGTTGKPLAGKGPASIVLYEDAENWLEVVPLTDDRL
jgi:hypothetical protein